MAMAMDVGVRAGYRLHRPRSKSPFENEDLRHQVKQHPNSVVLIV
jgi:hypothetical protein